MTLRRVSLLPLLAASLVVLLAGCPRGGGDTPASGSGAPPAAEPSAAASGSGEPPAAAPAEGSAAAPAAGSAAAAPARTLTIYCGRNEEMIGPLIDRFKQETGVDVAVHYAGSAELVAKLREEGAASPADVFFSQDATTLAFAAGERMLAPIDAAAVASVPERYRGLANMWVVTSARARVLVYNTQNVAAAELPASVDALVEPAWRDQVAWAPENASFHVFVAGLIAERGEAGAQAWLEAMRANGARAYPSNSAIVQAVGNGEVKAGLTNHYYLYRLRAEHGADFPAANHYFANGKAESMMSMSGVGILATADARAEADRFVAFLLSEPSQRYFAEQTYEFPAVAGVATVDELRSVNLDAVPRYAAGTLDDLAPVHRVLTAAGVTL